MTYTADTATDTGRTAAIFELAAAWRAVDAADMAGDDTGDRLIRDTYRMEDAYVAAGVLTWGDVDTARRMAATPAPGMTPAARASLAAHVAIARHVRPSSPAPAVTPGTGATFGPWADHGTRCRCNVCR